MSVGRNTLKATMRRTWNAIKNPFRRRTGDETHLHDDYPAMSDSEFTDDEERRREWLRHLNRRATIANEGVTDFGVDPEDYDNRVNDDWEYVSEYNVSFPSDSSIIDAYKEKKCDMNNHRPYKPSSTRQEDENHGYRCNVENERQLRHTEKRRTSLHPKSERIRNDSFSTRGERSPRITTPKTVVRERVSEIEKGSYRRRDSLHPSTKPLAKLNRQVLRRESSDRELSDNWIDNTTKKKVKKQMKNRRRARTISSDDSDVESVEMKSTKYTVNLTMDDLNDIIKKNISSAVKTIVSSNTKEKSTKRCMSPVESFSTESETIFSGSSSHSADTNHGGLLQKQIKAQLDRDKLKGLKRASIAVGNLQLQEAEPVKLSYSNPKRPSIAPILSAFNQQSPQLVLQESPQPQQHIPQVTFNLADTQSILASEFDPQPLTPVTAARRNSIMPSFRRPSIAPAGVMGNLDIIDPLGHVTQTDQMDQLSPSVFNTFDGQSGYVSQQDSATQNPFSVMGSSALSPAAIQRQRMRRHTLAAIHQDNSLGQSLDSRLDQLNNVLSMLDNSINNSEKDEKGTVKTAKKNTDNDGNSNKNDSVPEVKKDAKEETTRPLTIAEQIEALTKKKKKPKKPLKPGQMGLTGFARAMLIIIIIMFLLVGTGSLGVGVWMLMDPNIETYFDIINVDNNNQDFKMICYVLCSIGAFLLFIGFMGCCGTIRSSKCMLTVFIILTLVITLAEGGLGTMLMLNKDSTTAIPVLSALLSELGTTLKQQLTKSLVEKYDPETTIGSAWDLVQIQAECCGSSGPEDYKYSAWKNKTNDEDINLPDTCCVLVSKDAQEPEPSNMLLCQAGTIGFFHDTGCYDALLGWFKKNSSVLIAALIAVFAIEIFSLIFAIAICRKAHKDALKYKDTPGIR